MTPRKLNVRFATFPYGGNGASASEHPDGRDWLDDTLLKTRDDERVTECTVGRYNDTPITMTRNRAVADARRDGVDVLVMLDSDQAPDLELLRGDPEAVPFWDAAFNFLYDHYDRGPVCVAAPYMGGPPHENVFVFKWNTIQSDHPDDQFALEQYTRSEAANMAGIHECAALPTGLIMFDMRCFELTDPADDLFSKNLGTRLAELQGQVIGEELVRVFCEWAPRLKHSTEQSWFYYEYADKYQAEKHSTEDVTATRDISLAGQLKLGYNPVHCAWSSWAGHWKPKCVGKPQLLPADFVASKLRRAAESSRQSNMKQVELRPRGNGRGRIRAEDFGDPSRHAPAGYASPQAVAGEDAVGEVVAVASVRAGTEVGLAQAAHDANGGTP